MGSIRSKNQMLLTDFFGSADCAVIAHKFAVCGTRFNTAPFTATRLIAPLATCTNVR